MQTTPKHTASWQFYGCLMIGVVVLLGLCWFASLGYMTTMRMIGL